MKKKKTAKKCQLELESQYSSTDKVYYSSSIHLSRLSKRSMKDDLTGTAEGQGELRAELTWL